MKFLGKEHYKMKMMIDEFIWMPPFKLQSHDTHTYVLLDEFIWSSPGAWTKYMKWLIIVALAEQNFELDLRHKIFILVFIWRFKK